MLTEQQVEFIGSVSSGAHFGVVLGAVCGLLVTAAILIEQKRISWSDEGLIRLLYGLVPGAMSGAIATSVLTAVMALVEASYCQRGGKGGYVIPDRLESLVIVVELLVPLLTAGIAARLAIPDVGARRKSWSDLWRSAVVWSAVGALVGALAGVGRGFNGYFVLQSNAEPIRCAVADGLFLAIGSLLWRLTTGLTVLTLDGTDKLQPSEFGWKQLSSRARVAFVLSWCVFLFMVGVSTFGTVGVVFALDVALWAAVIAVGRLNVRLAWILFVIFCASQPLIVATSGGGWSFSISDSNTFPHLDTVRDAFHVMSLSTCGPMVWILMGKRLDEFNPMLYVFALPCVALLQGSVLWWLGDLLLRRRDAARRLRLALMVLAVFLLFGWAFVAHHHLLWPSRGYYFTL